MLVRQILILFVSILTAAFASGESQETGKTQSGKRKLVARPPENRNAMLFAKISDNLNTEYKEIFDSALRQPEPTQPSNQDANSTAQAEPKSAAPAD